MVANKLARYLLAAHLKAAKMAGRRMAPINAHIAISPFPFRYGLPPTGSETKKCWRYSRNPINVPITAPAATLYAALRRFFDLVVSKKYFISAAS
jgi:hypothetical protein